MKEMKTRKLGKPQSFQENGFHWNHNTNVYADFL